MGSDSRRRPSTEERLVMLIPGLMDQPGSNAGSPAFLPRLNPVARVGAMACFDCFDGVRWATYLGPVLDRDSFQIPLENRKDQR